jgi:hypothetical protein
VRREWVVAEECGASPAAKWLVNNWWRWVCSLPIEFVLLTMVP